MEDTYLLQRFVDAQKNSYDNVTRELKDGKKKSHWMWFVFPQVVGLGRTSTAEKYSIKSIDEAKAYIAHPVLGARLEECTKLMVNIEGYTANQIFGFPDDLKFRSSMTLFNHVAEENRYFDEAIVKYYDGKEDNLTLEVLKNWQDKPQQLYSPENKQRGF